MTDLAISKQFSLPVDAMTEAMALIATRKRGKTHTATVIAEEILRLHQQVVIMDPVGLYWGLRSSADGKAEGFKILIIGGAHADIPLAVADAATIAQFVVSEEASVVIDLSQLGSKGEQVRFCEVFFDRLWHLKQAHRSPMLLILEESQEFAPQRPREKEQVMLGRIERIAKLGRNYGIGLLLITQRPASLNKDVLDLIGIMFVLGIVAAIERKVVRDWLQGQDLGDHTDLVNNLPGLQRGTAYVWWPEAGMLKLIEIRARRTFDSSATPAVGQKRIEPGRRAEVDLEAYKAKLGSLIEKAKEEDPRELKRRIAELQRELVKAQRNVPVEIRERKVEIPTVPAKLIQLLRASGIELQTQGAQIIAQGTKLAAAGAEYGKHSSELSRGYRQSLAIESGRAHKGVRVIDDIKLIATSVDSVRKPRWEKANGSVSKAQQQILDAAAFLEERGITRPDVVQLALLARQSSGGGYWRSNIGKLRTLGLIDGTSLTDAGRALAQAPEITTSRELQDHVMGLLSGAQKAVLEALIEIYPGSLEAEDLARKVGLEAAGGYWRSCIGRLRTLQLITKRGPLAALPVLFIEEAVAV